MKNLKFLKNKLLEAKEYCENKLKEDTPSNYESLDSISYFEGNLYALDYAIKLIACLERLEDWKFDNCQSGNKRGEENDK